MHAAAGQELARDRGAGRGREVAGKAGHDEPIGPAAPLEEAAERMDHRLRRVPEPPIQPQPDEAVRTGPNRQHGDPVAGECDAHRNPGVACQPRFESLGRPVRREQLKLRRLAGVEMALFTVHRSVHSKSRARRPSSSSPR